MLETLIRLLRERGFTSHGEAILKLLDQEIQRLISLVERMLDVVDPDSCPSELLDYLASLFAVPFLPAASYAQKIEALQKAILTTVPVDKFTRLAEILNVDLSPYGTVEEQRVALADAVATATEEQVDQALYFLGYSYMLGVMTPEQKRLAIKQAISWYKVRGTELSYQIFLRVFGLQARIVPLWTKNYKSFWEEPQGSTVFEGGEWYPTPHYSLEFRRWTDQGTVSAEIFHLFTEVVRREVQPIQCVLTRISFTQEITDYVEFKDEAVVDLPLSTLDVIYWPYCDWQDKGIVFIPEPRRDQITGLRDGAGGSTFYDSIMFSGAGRAVGEWNQFAESYWDTSKTREQFYPGYEIIQAHFRRDNPRGPKWYLDLNQGGFDRGAVLLTVPEGSVPPGAEVTISGGKVYVNGTETDLPLAFFRDPDTCENKVDFIHYAGEDYFVDHHCYPFPRSVSDPFLRDGSFGDRSICLLADDAVVLEVTPFAEVDGVPEATDAAAYVSESTYQEVFCDFVWLRGGEVEFDREGFDFRVFSVDFTRLGGYFRDGSVPYDRHGAGPYYRDGSGGFRRDVYSFKEFPYFTRDDYYCYPDEFTWEIGRLSEDVFLVDDVQFYECDFVGTDTGPEPDEVLEQSLFTQPIDPFCPKEVLRDGSARFGRQECSWSALHHWRYGSDFSRRGDAPDDRRDEGTERLGITYRVSEPNERAGALGDRSGLAFDRAGLGWPRDGSHDRSVFSFESCLQTFFHRDLPPCVLDDVDLSITPIDGYDLPVETNDVLEYAFTSVTVEEEPIPAPTEEADLATGFCEDFCGAPLRCLPCEESWSSHCEPVTLRRDGTFRRGVVAGLSWPDRSGHGVLEVVESDPCRGHLYPRLAHREALRCGVWFERDGSEDRLTSARYVSRSTADADRLVSDFLAERFRAPAHFPCYGEAADEDFLAETVDAFSLEDTLSLETAVEIEPAYDRAVRPVDLKLQLAAGVPFEERPYGPHRDDPRLGDRFCASCLVYRCDGYPNREWNFPRWIEPVDFRLNHAASQCRFLDGERYGYHWRWEGAFRDGRVPQERGEGLPIEGCRHRFAYLSFAEDTQLEPIELGLRDEITFDQRDVLGVSINLTTPDHVDSPGDAATVGYAGRVERDPFCDLALRDGYVDFTRGVTSPLRLVNAPRSGWLDRRDGCDLRPRDCYTCPNRSNADFGRNGARLRWNGPVRATAYQRDASWLCPAPHRGEFCYYEDASEWALEPNFVEVVSVDDELAPVDFVVAFGESDAFPEIDGEENHTELAWCPDHFSGSPVRCGRSLGLDRDDACYFDPRNDPGAPDRGSADALREVYCFTWGGIRRGNGYQEVEDELHYAFSDVRLTDEFEGASDLLDFTFTAVEVDNAPRPTLVDFAGNLVEATLDRFAREYDRDGTLARTCGVRDRDFAGYRDGVVEWYRGYPDATRDGHAAWPFRVWGARDGRAQRYTGPLRSEGATDRLVSVFGDWVRRGDLTAAVTFEGAASVVFEDHHAWTTYGDFAGSSLWTSEDTAPAPSTAATSTEGSVVSEERFCPAELLRRDPVGVRSCGERYRYDGHPDRDWGLLRLTECDPEFRLCGSVARERFLEGPRDGSVDSRWLGELRSGAGDYNRDDVLLCDLYRRREITCYEDVHRIEISTVQMPEDEFRCFSPVLRETDWVRDGSFDCFDRTGRNCCGPWDTLEIIKTTCQRWDDPACHWDQEGVRWDP